MSRSPHPPAKILKDYLEAFTKFDHVFSPDTLNDPLLSQGYILETAPSVGIVEGTYFSRTEEE